METFVHVLQGLVVRETHLWRNRTNQPGTGVQGSRRRALSSVYCSTFHGLVSVYFCLNARIAPPTVIHVVFSGLRALGVTRNWPFSILILILSFVPFAINFVRSTFTHSYRSRLTTCL